MAQVNFLHSAYRRMLSKWRRCRDVAQGGDAVKNSTVEYLPKAKDMDTLAYERYKTRATFYNATWRTMAGLVGMMFRKPPKVEVQDAIAELLEDVDGTGKPFQLFLQAVAMEGLQVGRVGVLVDYPPSDLEKTKADVGGERPTMQMYTAESILNWRLHVVDSRSVPKMVVLQEEAEVQDPNDEFVTKTETRWRVLDLYGDANNAERYRQRVFRQKTGEGGASLTNERAMEFEQVGKDVFPTWNNKPMDFIPFVIMGVEDVSFAVEDPPLIDLVDMNLSHFRTNAIYEQCVSFCPPTMFLAGFKKEHPSDKIYVGSEEAIVSPDPAAKAQYIEYSGSALAALEKSLDRKETQMAVLGARMLEPMKKAVETAETESIHRKGEESLLASMSMAVSLGMTKALQWFCEWAGSPDENAVVELNRDFYPATMTPAMLTALISGWQQGVPGLSDQGLFDALKAGEIIGEDVDLEEEQARIAERQQQAMQQMVEQQTALAEASGGDEEDPAVPPTTSPSKKPKPKKPKVGAVGSGPVA